MPTYEYQCVRPSCGHRFTRFRSVNFRENPVECPECGWPSKRVISAPALQKNKGTKLRKKLDKKKSPLR